jgi:hypothetical protein
LEPDFAGYVAGAFDPSRAVECRSFVAKARARLGYEASTRDRAIEIERAGDLASESGPTQYAGAEP